MPVATATNNVAATATPVAKIDLTAENSTPWHAKKESAVLADENHVDGKVSSADVVPPGDSKSVSEMIAEDSINQPLDDDGPNQIAIKHYGLKPIQIDKIKRLQEKTKTIAVSNFHQQLVFHDNVEGCSYMVEYVRNTEFQNQLRHDFYKEMLDIVGEPFAAASLSWLKSDFILGGYMNKQLIRFFVEPADPDIIVSTQNPGIPIVRVQYFFRGEPQGMPWDSTMAALSSFQVNLTRQ